MSPRIRRHQPAHTRGVRMDKIAEMPIELMGKHIELPAAGEREAIKTQSIKIGAAALTAISVMIVRCDRSSAP